MLTCASAPRDCVYSCSENWVNPSTPTSYMYIYTAVEPNRFTITSTCRYIEDLATAAVFE